MSFKITQPMLAGTLDQESMPDLAYPVLATQKLDGIRALTLPPTLEGSMCQVVSRKWKPIPNYFIRERMEMLLPPGLDGELVVMSGGKIASFQECSSGIMGRSGEPDFKYLVFDYCPTELTHGYQSRMRTLQRVYARMTAVARARVELVLPTLIDSEDALLAYENKCLSEGHEGVMLRAPMGEYKCGRSTLRERGLLKLKRFATSEAYVVHLVEAQENTNEKEMDAFGRAKRSQAKGGKVGKGTLGALVLKPHSEGAPLPADFDYIKNNLHRLDAALNSHPYLYTCGSGFDEKTRRAWWESPSSFIGQIVSIKSQLVGKLIKPRFPIWQGFRSPDDI